VTNLTVFILFRDVYVFNINVNALRKSKE